MRKVFLLIMTAVMLCCPLTASASRGVPNTEGMLFVVKCNDYISLRSYASTSAPVLAHIPLGASVRFVRSAANGFSYVYYRGSLGYIMNDYLY